VFRLNGNRDALKRPGGQLDVRQLEVDPGVKAWLKFIDSNF